MSPRRTESSSRPPSARPDDTPTSQRSPRSTVQAVGLVFQAVGGIYILGACLVWVLSAGTFRAAERPPPHWLEYLSGQHLPAALLTVGILTTLVGGVGLAAVGMGMQGERPTSGRAAIVVTTILAAIYWGLFAVLSLAGAGSWILSLAAAVIAVASTVLIPLAAHSADILRRFPPPADQNIVRDDELEGARPGNSPIRTDHDRT